MGRKLWYIRGGGRFLAHAPVVRYLRVFRSRWMCYRERLRTIRITTFWRHIKSSILRGTVGPGGIALIRVLSSGGDGPCSGVGNARSLRGMAEPGDGAGLPPSSKSLAERFPARYNKLAFWRWRVSFNWLRVFRRLVSYLSCGLLAFIRAFCRCCRSGCASLRYLSSSVFNTFSQRRRSRSRLGWFALEVVGNLPAYCKR